MDRTELLRQAFTSQEFAKMHNVKGVCIKQKYNLYPYQVDAIDWMKDRERTGLQNGMQGGIMCMEMGMGKTFVALVHSLSTPATLGPTLIITSKTIMTEWKVQGIEKFFEHVNVIYLHRDFVDEKTIVSLTPETIKAYDLVITTYDVCVGVNKTTKYFKDCFEMAGEQSLARNKLISVNLRSVDTLHKYTNNTGFNLLYTTQWERIICDESQRFVNFETTTYHCMMALVGKYKWCISGTPIMNYDTDIWAQFRFCGYKTITTPSGWKKSGPTHFKLEQLGDWIYNVTYEDVGITLPEKTEINHVVAMDEFQAGHYQNLKDKSHEIYNKMINGDLEYTCMLSMFMHLRQCAISPYLLLAESKRKNTIKSKKLVETRAFSAKILKIIDIIRDIPSSDKICFFTSFTSFSDLLAIALAKFIPDVKFLQFDGDTLGSERQRTLSLFKEESYRILILTYKIGGEGLNIIEANHCIFGEPWWSSSVLEQAKSRMWRTGQTKPVYIYNIITKDTVEERIVEIYTKKKKLINDYMSGATKSIEKFNIDKLMMGKIIGVY